jgi:hypothetical protein
MSFTRSVNGPFGRWGLSCTETVPSLTASLAEGIIGVIELGLHLSYNYENRSKEKNRWREHLGLP